MPPRAISNPPNPWHGDHVEYLGEAPRARLQVFHDASRSVVAKNDSPDVGFDFSVNPYRGCMHACAYCYARPSHEYLDFGAGTDFDRKIVVKRDAPELLRARFDQKSWTGAFVLFSGNTDCYQPLEATYALTRACLEVCRDYRNPCGIITKAPLIERDIDVLKQLHAVTDVGITISIPFWDKHKARGVEPYVATPRRRMDTVKRLADAGLDVGVNVAPMIPGLADEDIPQILEAAAAAGAKYAGLIFLRLPGPVKAIFAQRIREAFPMRADKILHKIREARGGKLNDPRFGNRMRGEGPYATAVEAMFEAHCQRLGLRRGMADTGSRPSTFRRPPRAGDQLALL